MRVPRLLSLVLTLGVLMPTALFGQGSRNARDRTQIRPNIILIVADDLGWGDLGSYGQTKIRTPNLDRMAADGMRFTQFYAGSPVCAPSRSVLMTGKHGGHAYIRDNREMIPEGQEPIPASEVTIAELLKSQGYATGAFGKWGLGFVGTSGDPNRQGFDRFFGYNSDNGGAFGEVTSDFEFKPGRLGGTDYVFFNSTGPFRAFKGSIYEGDIRVPLIVRWPGKIRARTASELPATFYDVLPTLCDAAGMEAPQNTDGLSILPTLLGKGQQKKHDFLFWDFNGYGGQQAVRLGNWKGLHRNLQRGESKIELYNLATDISEQNDVADGHPDIVGRIANIMRREHTPSQIFPMKFLDDPQPKPQARGYSIPLVDLADEKERQVIVDREPGQYLGHPTTVMLEDNKTIMTFCPRITTILCAMASRGLSAWNSRD